MAVYNNKNYGNRKVYVANSGAGAVGSDSFSDVAERKPRFEVMEKEKTNTTPRFLMCLEVIFIILCLLSPIFIGRKDRINKKKDMATAEFIGSQFEKGLESDDTLKEYAQKGAQLVRANKSSINSSSTKYRILGYMEADNEYPIYYFHTQSVGVTRLDLIGNSGMRSKIKKMTEESDLKMKFNKGIFFNQWIIAIDGDEQIHIFAGGGVNRDSLYISKTHNLKGGRANRVYEVYPNVDLTYRLLLSKTINGWKY